MKKNFRFLGALLLSALLTSCATSVRVKVTRPAELDMRGAKTIAVLPFQPSNAKLFRGRGTKNDLLGLFINFMTVDPQENDCIRYLDKELLKHLLGAEELKVVEADRVKNALEKGEEPPCDVYLTGKVENFHTKLKSHERKCKDDEDNVYYETFYTLKVLMDISYQIIDTKTYEVIAFREVTIDVESYDFETPGYAPRPIEVIESNLKRLAKDISQQVQPYDEYVDLVLLDDKEKNEENKLANKLADEGLIEESLEKYENFYKKTGNFVAGYNAALLLQARGQLEDARNLMKELVDKTADKRAITQLSKIDFEIEQAEKLQSQRNAREE